MAEHLEKNVPQGTAEHPGWFLSCPSCGSEGLMAVTTEAVMGCDQVENLLCTICSRCWHAEGATLRQVDRYLCPGCPERLRCFQPLIYGGLPAPPGTTESSATQKSRGDV